MTRVGTGTRYRIQNTGRLAVTGTTVTADGAPPEFVRPEEAIPAQLSKGQTFDVLVLGPEVRAVVVSCNEVDDPQYLLV